MLIRQENSTDYNKVYDVVKKAFESAEHSDGNEQDLVVALRNSTAFIPELALVAEINSQIVGHLMFTKIQIGSNIELALAPLSVLPEYQRQGIGTALMAEGHKIAKEKGFNYSVVLGSEFYYPKVGYVPAEKFGIKAPFDVPTENLMVLNLQGKDIQISGTVEYPKEFGI